MPGDTPHSPPLDRRHVLALFGAATLVVWSATLIAQRGPIATLRGVAVPRPTNLRQYVADEGALIALGKALFWDVQVGSDGRTACATCHFHAGADHRLTNQLADPPNASAGVRPNQTLHPEDFPFHAFTDPSSNQSPRLRNRREVVGSAGVVPRSFVDVLADSIVEASGDAPAPGPFTVGGRTVRQVTGRNAPSVINAVFYVRSFWDGRANDVFTGATPFGDADARANVLVMRAAGLDREAVSLDNASLASQAVGPPLNAVEMSFDGRSWPALGKKLLPLIALARQQVALDDSVLGPMAQPDGTGLRSDLTYDRLVRAAFHSAYWRSPAVLDRDGRTIDPAGLPATSREHSQMEFNFALFFGLAIQAYEATLIADDSPADRFLAGDVTALSAVEQQGLNEFRANQSQCNRCHQGPELSAAGFTTSSNVRAADPRSLGFFRTGVSTIGDDSGAAGADGFGQPLFPAAPANRAAGAFKSPGLRNVELTGPYFHNGGAATLQQVMEFYARNGDVPAGGNLGPGMGNIQLSAEDRAQIVAFMKALTDTRVRFERAPFDHPALCVPTGHVETAAGTLRPDTSSDAVPGSAADVWALVPAVGRAGSAVPLQTFEELLHGIGSDGSRAHSMQMRCVP
jgi:cytochrome c peroxidase